MGFAARFRDTLARGCRDVPWPDGRVGIAAWDLDDGEPVLLDADRRVPAASTIKVLLLVTALRQVASRRMRLDDEHPLPRVEERCGGTGVLAELTSVTRLSVADLLTLMIVVSDNTATNLVIDLVGFEVIEACAADLGCGDTAVRRHLMDHEAMVEGRDNVTTARDQARILDQLARGHALPEGSELTAWALELLERQQIRDRLPARLPLTAASWNKTGEQLGLRHDVGLLGWAGRPRVVLAVLVDDLTDRISGTGYRGGPACEFIATVAEDAYRAAKPTG